MNAQGEAATITVGDLIERLSAMPQDAVVALHIDSNGRRKRLHEFSAYTNDEIRVQQEHNRVVISGWVDEDNHGAWV